jgi:hypothetical protein
VVLRTDSIKAAPLSDWAARQAEPELLVELRPVGPGQRVALRPVGEQPGVELAWEPSSVLLFFCNDETHFEPRGSYCAAAAGGEAAGL